MGDEVEIIKAKIAKARKRGKEIHENRAKLAGVMSGAFDTIGVEVEFPEPDTMNVYRTMFGIKVGEPITYRLSFGSQLKWVGVSHPWGVKPADIFVDDLRE